MVLSSDASALIEGLVQELAALRAENAALKQEIAELRRRLDKDSSNSSKPSSSDGPAKKPRIARSLRGVSGKKSGGQPGHRGDTLRPVANPDKIERREATRCGRCLAALTAAMVTRVEKRQVFEMPQPRLEVTEHQVPIYICVCCRSETRAAFPAEVSAHVQYGPRIRAAAIYLNVQHLIPEDRVGDIMHDLFGAPLLCPTSIAAWGGGKALEWAVVEAVIATQVATAAVRHLDETGFRIAGKTRWLHTVSTAAMTCYRVTGGGGSGRQQTIIHSHSQVSHSACSR